MTISISNVDFSTQAFIVIFLFALLISFRKHKERQFFSLKTTQEIKGLAILAILFSHIGYFLITDHRFLWPLSIMAGVGVNLFLFLSGYGLTLSSIRNPLKPWPFYKIRLTKLFIPLWLTISSFLFLDYWLLQKTYDLDYILRSVLGIFPRAELFQDLNSPFWYFTLILFYYLIFPWLFDRKRPWVTAGLIFLISYLIIIIKPAYFELVYNLHKSHYFAFPLGIFFGWLFYEPVKIKLLSQKFNDFLNTFEKPNWLMEILALFRQPNFLHRWLKIIKPIIYYCSIILLLFVAGYTAIHSGVGEGIYREQLISLLTMASIILLFLMKKIEIKLFFWFGFFSYEIYLLHWPILSRYDFLYKTMPAWLATISYLILFILLGFLLKKISDKAYQNINKLS